jgi:hypothetical protein
MTSGSSTKASDIEQVIPKGSDIEQVMFSIIYMFDARR